MRQYRMDANRVDDGGYCEACDDDNGEGTRPTATLSIGPIWSSHNLTLCTACLTRLAELATFAIAKYGKVPR